ncbi:MAG: hypothetical protein MUC53_10555 [Candidatus Contendobacter sp.]|jgi:hypothetical protein|nr:hypothetical protein [Candidatus Contendobacter sp.]
MTDILQQKRAYRRGLILGLTMAESVILIIFALLLALAAFLIQKDQTIEQMRGQIADATADQQRCAAALAEARVLQEKQIADATADQQRCAAALAEARVLQEKMATIQALTQGANNFDEMFKELVLMQRQAQRTAELEQQVVMLIEKQQALEKAVQGVETAPVGGQTLAEKLEHLVERAIVCEQLVKSLPQSDSPATLRELEQRLAALMKLEAALSAAMPGVEPAEAVRSITDELQASRVQMTNLQGQMANLRRRLEGAGKGTEKPACWATPDGRPEYIFDVALRSGGVTVRDNALSHRAEEQRQLPLGSFGFNREVSLTQFRAAAQPLREWSRQHECMFFVRIQDQTGPSQKAVYKQKLRTVGEFFYYYEPP